MCNGPFDFLKCVFKASGCTKVRFSLSENTIYFVPHLLSPSRLKKRKKMPRARKHEGPLRPGELSADYELNKVLIRSKLKREGDFQQCYCAFFPRLTPTCKCIQCPECIMKGRDFVNGMCQMCHCKCAANIHHNQPSALSM